MKERIKSPSSSSIHHNANLKRVEKRGGEREERQSKEKMLESDTLAHLYCDFPKKMLAQTYPNVVVGCGFQNSFYNIHFLLYL